MNVNKISFCGGIRCLFLLLAVIVLGTGCSGIQASKSISPLDFIIPGFGMTGTPDEGLTQTGGGVAAPQGTLQEPSTS